MATANTPPPPRSEYKVGWVGVTLEECMAAEILLDENYGSMNVPNDDYKYVVGRLGEHYVAIAQTNSVGKSSAADAARSLARSFTNVRFVLMVGIGGGATTAPAPGGANTQPIDIRVGDVVVSTPHGDHGGIIQYDMGKWLPEGYKRGTHLNRPPLVLIQEMKALQRRHEMGRGDMKKYIQDGVDAFNKMNISVNFNFPGRDNDLLFSSEYHHPKTSEKADRCGKCNQAYLKSRQPRKPDNPKVHYGLIASTDSLMQDPARRDAMRKENQVLCFEMEAAGLMNNFPCLAIRGICDYADTHKNDVWQPYAALAAAAYAKELLLAIPSQRVTEATVPFWSNSR